jgi:antibiotic biosynthesis monooxygenase (ABM) superfamily enzyme
VTASFSDLKPTAASSPGDAPFKIVLERQVRPGGSHEAFASWVHQLLESAGATGALQGSSVLRSGDKYFVLLRFASRKDLDGWHGSPAAAALLRRGEELAESADHPLVRSGLETWFTIPGLGTAPKPPPRWKMALVTWLALLPQVLLLGRVVPQEWPTLLKAAVSTAIPVILLTWLLMPNLTRLLQRWLYERSVHS